jgi:hypothetical protein
MQLAMCVQHGSFKLLWFWQESRDRYRGWIQQRNVPTVVFPSLKQ